MLDADTAARFAGAGIRELAGAGVDWLQLRDREAEGGALLALAEDLYRDAHAAGARLLVNRRVDVALAAGADGVHLGFDALPAARARALLPAEAEVGVSTHAPDEIPGHAGASYVHLAPIHAPLSKPSERPPLGLAALREARRHGVPVLAQGGLEPANAAEAVAAGASGIAVTGAIGQADDPVRAVRALREALDA